MFKDSLAQKDLNNVSNWTASDLRCNDVRGLLNWRRQLLIATKDLSFTVAKKKLHGALKSSYSPPSVDRIWLWVYSNKIPTCSHILSTSGGL